MPLARIDEVIDALAERINELWPEESRASSFDEVVASSRFSLKPESHFGRKVYLFATRYTGGPITRGEDQNDYTITILVAEVYRRDGELDEAWVRERKYFVAWLIDQLGNPRNPRLLPDSPGGGLYPHEAAVTVVVDYDEINENMMFGSTAEITYREDVEA